MVAHGTDCGRVVSQIATKGRDARRGGFAAKNEPTDKLVGAGDAILNSLQSRAALYSLAHIAIGGACLVESGYRFLS
ncbi:hypothetical protein LMG3412_06537 [Achromobacter deleyi]|nr:hypothetical protein LMG3412_06537 [Achromobacter deleyi]